MRRVAVGVRPGPVITMYEFKPAARPSLTLIVMLAADLPGAARRGVLRILAPITLSSSRIEIPTPRRKRKVIYVK